MAPTGNEAGRPLTQSEANTADESGVAAASPPRTLSIVIPVYFNADSLPELKQQLDWIDARLAERGMQLETVFVDDGSQDASHRELLAIRDARPRTRVVKLLRNFGAVPASKAGLRFATGDCLTIMAADLQEPPEQVIQMVDRWLAGSRFVISVRRHRGDPLSTRLLARCYYVLFRHFVLHGYPEGGFDLMVIDASLFAHMRDIPRFASAEIYAYWLGVEPEVLEYDRLTRKYGKSRWTLRKKINYFLDNFTGFSAFPLRFISAIGLVSALLSFIYGLVVIAGALFSEIEVPGFASLAVLISFFSGLILMILTLIGEYLWRIFYILSNRPDSIVDRTD